jgi:hypothetical protein
MMGMASGQKLTVADHVADRVDRPGHVVRERDTHQPGPEERGGRVVGGEGHGAGRLQAEKSGKPYEADAADV